MFYSEYVLHPKNNSGASLPDYVCIHPKSMLQTVKVPPVKSCHSEVVLATLPGTYFRLTRPGLCINKWRESCNFTLNGHWDIKTACVELPVAKSDKNCFKRLATFFQNEV